MANSLSQLRKLEKAAGNWLLRCLPHKYSLPKWVYAADGFAVRSKDIRCILDERFMLAYKAAERLNAEAWPGGVPDVRWRAHVCCWAAHNGLRLEGDFVECGVFAGIFSLTVMNYLDFNATGRHFHLFDTFDGLPVSELPESEQSMARDINKALYFDCFELAQRNFSGFKHAHLVKGILPGSLDSASIDKIAYLSMDLNSASAEEATIERLWPKLVRGGMVVIDDYAFPGHTAQYDMWNRFAAKSGRLILTVPTGQGILVK